MYNNIFENSLYTNAQERDELLKDKTKVMNALVINFLGFLSLYKLSDSRGVMKTYNSQEGRVRIQAISDTNNDVTVAIKLAFDARLLPMGVVNEMTRLLSLVKQRQVRGKDMDDEKVRDIAKKMKLQSNRPSPRLLAVAEDFMNGTIPLDLVASRLWTLTKLPDFQEYATEFRDLYRKGQYAALSKAAEEIHSPTKNKVEEPVSIPVINPVTPVQVAQPKNNKKSSVIKKSLSILDRFIDQEPTNNAPLNKTKIDKNINLITPPQKDVSTDTNIDDIVEQLIKANMNKPDWDAKFHEVVKNRTALEKYVDRVDSDENQWHTFKFAMGGYSGSNQRTLVNHDIVDFYKVYGSKKRKNYPPMDRALFQYGNVENPAAVKAWFIATLSVKPDRLLEFIKGEDKEDNVVVMFANKPVYIELAHALKDSGILGSGEKLLDNLNEIISTTARGSSDSWSQAALRILIGSYDTAEELYKMGDNKKALEEIYPELANGQIDDIVAWFNDPLNDEIEYTEKYSYTNEKQKINKYDFLVNLVMNDTVRTNSNFPHDEFNFSKLKDENITPELKKILKEAFEKSTSESEVGLREVFDSELISQLYISKVRAQAMDPNVEVGEKKRLAVFVFEGQNRYDEFDDIVGRMLRDPIVAPQIIETSYIHDLKQYITLLNKDLIGGNSDAVGQVNTTVLILDRMQAEPSEYRDEYYNGDMDFITTKLGDFLIPLAIDQDINFVNENLEKIKDKKQRMNVMKNLVESVVLSKNADEINNGDPIRPITPIDSARIPQMLRFNNVTLPGFSVGLGDDYKGALERASAIKIELPKLDVSEVDLTDMDLERLTARIDTYRSGKHGDIALVVKKAFDVNIKEQADGVAKFKEMKPKSVVIDPTFHGTGSQAACFILRYGFTVPPASDGSVVGRMLGDGIYIADTTDKASQYITDSGYGRGLGSEGYLLEMEAVLGDRGIDFESAGVDDSKVLAPEWCIRHGNSQLKIRRAYFVELVKSDTLNTIRKKYNAKNESVIKSFTQTLTEAKNKEHGLVRFSFLKGNIPIDYNKYIDYTEFKPSKFGSHVSLENGQNGPTVVFKTKDPNDFETFVFEFGEDIFENKKVAKKFLKLLKKP